MAILPSFLEQNSCRIMAADMGQSVGPPNFPYSVECEYLIGRRLDTSSIVKRQPYTVPLTLREGLEEMFAFLPQQILEIFS